MGSEMCIRYRREDVYNHFLSLDLTELLSLDGIFCFSGDGHIHEIINGLMTRIDFKMKKNPISIAHFPSGSGCVLSEYMSKVTNTCNSIDSVLAAVCRWRTTKIPIYKYKISWLNQEEVNLYGFLSLSIGYFADVDIESEFLRFLGNGRFEVYGIWRFLALKKYWLKVKWKREQIDSTIGFGEFSQEFQPEIVFKDSLKIKKIINYNKVKKSFLEIIPEQSSIYEDLSSELITDLTSSYSGKLFSILITTLPFLSKDHLCSPSLLHELGYFNLQISPTSMGRSAFYKYISKNDFSTLL